MRKETIVAMISELESENRLLLQRRNSRISDAQMTRQKAANERVLNVLRGKLLEAEKLERDV